MVIINRVIVIIKKKKKKMRGCIHATHTGTYRCRVRPIQQQLTRLLFICVRVFALDAAAAADVYHM